jgi:hypothetical protein
MKALCLLLIVMNIAVALWEYRHNNPLPNNPDNTDTNSGEAIVLINEAKPAPPPRPAEPESNTPEDTEATSP